MALPVRATEKWIPTGSPILITGDDNKILRD
jgi:hypothetical protein